jgi:hypothetical protein
LKCKVDLLRDQAWRDSFCQCVLPEITHQAVERAFTIGQENSGNSLESSVPENSCSLSQCQGLPGSSRFLGPRRLIICRVSESISGLAGKLIRL